MQYVIYQYSEDNSYKMYVTHIYEGSIGRFNNINEAGTCDEENANKLLEWLNNPETHYGPTNEYFKELIKQ